MRSGDCHAPSPAGGRLFQPWHCRSVHSAIAEIFGKYSICPQNRLPQKWHSFLLYYLARRIRHFRMGCRHSVRPSRALAPSASRCCPQCSDTAARRCRVETKIQGAVHRLDRASRPDGRREGWANWDEGAYKGESLGSIGTDVTRQRVFSSRTGPRERSMEAGNRVIVRSDAAGCTRGPGGREFGGVGLDADSAVRLGVGWLAVGPGREWPAQPRASLGEDAK